MANDIFPGAKLMQGKEWGFPQGSPRPTPDGSLAFSVIHITGNPGNPIATAEGEAIWRNGDPDNQNSATFFVNRDGSVVQFLGDPLHMDPWSNGDVNQPDLSNRKIAAASHAGVNANERTLLSIENVGRPNDLPITQAQKRTNAKILAHYHKKAGVPINRTSIVGHYQLNSVTRPNCPAINKDILDEIVTMARAEAGLTTQGGEDPAVIEELQAQLAECKSISERRRKRIVAIAARRDALLAEIEALEAQIEELETQVANAATNRIRLRALRNRLAAVKAKIAAVAEDIADD